MDLKRTTWCHACNIVSRIGAHQQVLEQVASALEDAGWPSQDVFHVLLALEESLTNAIRHGNRQDESKVVEIEVKLGADQFWAQVRDEGDGFCRKKVPDPTAAENLLKTGGRGVTLIHAFMTDVSYNDKGNCVTLVKEREPSPDTSDD